MNKLKITNKKWCGVEYAGYYEIQATEKYGGNSLIDANVTPEADDNVTLCCDAGNTYQKCGLMPSELLEALKNTRKFLIMLLIVFWMMNLCVLVVGIRL